MSYDNPEFLLSKMPAIYDLRKAQRMTLQVVFPYQWRVRTEQIGAVQAKAVLTVFDLKQPSQYAFAFDRRAAIEYGKALIAAGESILGNRLIVEHSPVAENPKEERALETAAAEPPVTAMAGPNQPAPTITKLD